MPFAITTAKIGDCAPNVCYSNWPAHRAETRVAPFIAWLLSVEDDSALVFSTATDVEVGEDWDVSERSVIDHAIENAFREWIFEWR